MEISILSVRWNSLQNKFDSIVEQSTICREHLINERFVYFSVSFILSAEQLVEIEKHEHLIPIYMENVILCSNLEHDLQFTDHNKLFLKNFRWSFLSKYRRNSKLVHFKVKEGENIHNIYFKRVFEREKYHM